MNVRKVGVAVAVLLAAAVPAVPPAEATTSEPYSFVLPFPALTTSRVNVYAYFDDGRQTTLEYDHHLVLLDNGSPIAQFDVTAGAFPVQHVFEVALEGPGRHRLEVAPPGSPSGANDQYTPMTVTVLAAHTTAVDALYGGLLRRPGDPGGQAAFRGRPLQTVAASMMASPEYRAVRVQFDLFEPLLHEDGDSRGIAFWVQRARATSFTTAAIDAMSFASTQVRGPRYDTLSDAFVQLLGRGMTAEEEATLRQYGISTALRFIVSTEEGRRAAVDRAYERLLGRAPDAGAYATWLPVTPDGLATDRMLAGIVASAEFQHRFVDG